MKKSKSTTTPATATEETMIKCNMDSKVRESVKALMINNLYQVTEKLVQPLIKSRLLKLIIQ